MNDKKLLSLLNLVRAVVALLAAFGVVSFAAGNPGGLTTDTKTDTVAKTEVKVVPPAPDTTKVDNADADAQPDNTVTVTPKAQDVEQALAVGAAKGTNDLQPREAPNLPALKGKVTGPIAELQPPYASDSVPGCRTRFLKTNWSGRAPGARVLALALHYTAGPDVPNSRSDVDGLTVFGNQSGSAVSWAGNMDKDGNCDYNVPYRYKAWTIAGLNSETVNYEIAGKGNDPYLRPGGYKELARIWVDFHRRYPYIPLRLGATDGHCHVTRTGIITHWMGGPCSGGHIDIKPLSITGVIAELGRYVQAMSCSKRCHEIKRVRGIHQRTHARVRKNKCSPAKHGYCDTLRARNKNIHKVAKREHISLKGTF